jgi:hypothetical protein
LDPGQGKRLRAIGWLKNFISYKPLPEPDVDTLNEELDDEA